MVFRGVTKWRRIIFNYFSHFFITYWSLYGHFLISSYFKLLKDVHISSLRGSMLNIRLVFILMFCRAPIGSKAKSATRAWWPTPDWLGRLSNQHHFKNLLSWLVYFWTSIYWKRVKSMQNWRKNSDGSKKKIFQKCQNSQIFAIFWDRAILVE